MVNTLETVAGAKVQVGFVSFGVSRILADWFDCDH